MALNTPSTANRNANRAVANLLPTLSTVGTSAIRDKFKRPQHSESRGDNREMHSPDSQENPPNGSGSPKSPQMPTDNAPLPIRAKRFQSLQVLFSGLAVFVAVVLPAVGLLVQIFVVHPFYFTSYSLVTLAPLGPTLAIAHTCSSVVSATLPFVMGLDAYRISRIWLTTSRAGGDNRPTPFQ